MKNFFTVAAVQNRDTAFFNDADAKREASIKGAEKLIKAHESGELTKAHEAIQHPTPAKRSAEDFTANSF